MATDGSSNESEAARLRELAQRSSLAANISDPATISAMRQMANDYEADADELDAYSPRDEQTALQPSMMAAPRNSSSCCFLEALLLRPVLDHGAALVLMLAAIAVPPLLRASVSEFVPGNEFLAYVPFVFLAALLLQPWAAGSVAAGSAGRRLPLHGATVPAGGRSE